MMGHKTYRLLAGVLSLASLPTQSSIQSSLWQKQMVAATKAYQQGRYHRAEELLEAALDKAENFGLQDRRLAINLNNLAEAYRVQGKYTEAKPLYQKALAIWEKVRQPGFPYVAIGLNNLALLYAAQGKYDKAERLYQRSLAIWEEALGPDHRAVATSLENYASLLRKTNREAEAAKMEARAKAIRAKQRGRNPTNRQDGGAPSLNSSQPIRHPAHRAGLAQASS
ncbi:MAG: tetratricopeptide repeat protein [Candidatus Binatia bacterium]